MLATAKAFGPFIFFHGLFFNAGIRASPLESARAADILDKRQGLISGLFDSDPSGIAAEDGNLFEILADGTGPLRSAVPARDLYTNQPTATWYQVQTGTTDVSASFTPFTTTTPQDKPIPAPDDKNQVRGPNPWNVDHIFELQVIGEAFKAAKPTNIPDADWASATKAVFTSGPMNSAIASAVTNLKNLQGIPNALNSFKKQVFTGNLTGKGGPSSGSDATFFNFFGPAVQKYLSDNQAALLSGTVDETGNQLQSAGNNNAEIKSYFTSYASLHYQGCIDFLSTWSGRPLDRSTPSTTSASATITAPAPPPTSTGAAVKCFHAADPRNTCAAIANGPGWCNCENDSATYAVMPSPAPQPCAWTTTPPTTSFDCSTPVPTCIVPDGCTNAWAPSGCAILCE